MAEVIYLVRHAAPPEENRCCFWGRSDPGVDPASLDEVEALASLAWERPDQLLTSPSARAVTTADRLGGALGLRPQVVADLAEVDYGLFDGLSDADARALYPDKMREWERLGDGFTFPGGESLAGFFARATMVWEYCVDMRDTTVMVVTHAGVIAAWICLFLGIPFVQRSSFRPEYAALTAVTRRRIGEGWYLSFFNDRPRLARIQSRDRNST